MRQKRLIESTSNVWRNVSVERTTSNALTLTFTNEGRAGAIFHVCDRHRLDQIPRRYTVEAGKSLHDIWAVGKDGAFDLVVLGPNGFLRAFTGDLAQAAPVLTARYDTRGKAVRLRLASGVWRLASGV